MFRPSPVRSGRRWLVLLGTLGVVSATLLYFFLVSRPRVAGVQHEASLRATAPAPALPTAQAPSTSVSPRMRAPRPSRVGPQAAHSSALSAPTEILAPALDDPGGELESDTVRRRADWFLSQRAYPLGFIPPGARLESLKQLDQMIETQTRLGLIQPLSAQADETSIGFPGPTMWTLIGPQRETGLGANFGNPLSTGRTTALAIHPSAPNTVYLGGAAGGVWRTTNGGASWANLNFDQQPSLAIGAIEIAPSDAMTIYVGTGENHFAFDNYYGAGIIKSTDGGTTWTQHCGGAGIANRFCNPTGTGRLSGGYSVGGIAVHPTDPNIVLVAVRNPNNLGESGIYRSTDGGLNFSQVASASGAPGNSVVFNPTTPTIVYAGLGGGGAPVAATGIYKSTDGGVSFTRLTGADPNLPTTNIARTEVRLAPGTPSTIYAAISTTDGSSLRAFVRSIDNGASWTVFTPGTLPALPNFCAGQCFYDMTLIVDPTNSMRVFVGGSAFTNNSSTVFRTQDGGSTWTDITTGSSPVRPHVDTHAFAFTPTGGRLYIGTDGGVWFTDTPTAAPPTWQAANNPNLALTQFYPGHAPHPMNENQVFGGTQDNGWLK